MNKELAEILRAYLLGAKTMDDCYEWLAGVDWNDPGLDSDLQKALGSFELLAIEAFEGIRDESEFYSEAADFVAKVTGSRYSVPKSQVVAVSPASSSEDV